MKVYSKGNVVLLEIRMRKVADNLWHACLASDPEITALGVSPSVVREDLKNQVSIALGIPIGTILFTKDNHPHTEREVVDLASVKGSNLENMIGDFRKSQSDSLNIARRAMRRLIIEESLTPAEAARIVGITPAQVVALVEG